MDLERFIKAQKRSYETALAEIYAGQKRSHWMWFIFPQIKGLGLSSMSQFYAIWDINEAQAYLNDPVLGPRLVEISRALLQHKNNSANQVFGSPDDMKLRSSMTLFAAVAGSDKVFKDVLDSFFGGEPDERTLTILNSKN